MERSACLLNWCHSFLFVGNCSRTEGIPTATDWRQSEHFCEESWSKLPGGSAHHARIRFVFRAVLTGVLTTSPCRAQIEIDVLFILVSNRTRSKITETGQWHAKVGWLPKNKQTTRQKQTEKPQMLQAVSIRCFSVDRWNVGSSNPRVWTRDTHDGHRRNGFGEACDSSNPSSWRHHCKFLAARRSGKWCAIRFQNNVDSARF